MMIVIVGAWMICSVMAYCIMRKAFRLDGSWSPGDRILGLFFSLSGPVSLGAALIVLGAVKAASDTRKARW